MAEKKKAPKKNAAWEKHLKEYKERNPVKFAQKKENGEFDKVPPSFA